MDYQLSLQCSPTGINLSVKRYVSKPLFLIAFTIDLNRLSQLSTIVAMSAGVLRS